ncbi:MAG: regulatory protein RecX [Oscillibacter sp.]|nr:regulatory protein RecX [uncultured Oscillibacter sp.]MCI8970699.1 regulatory protein RecX [Oscillibacter sp.]
MRIERIEASRHKKGRILVFLEDGACLKITEQELLDFGLRSGDDLGQEALGQLKEAAGVSNTRAAAADLIGKRAMSRRDLERKLREKGANEAEARYAAEWLEAIGALNDAEYAAALVRHYSGMGYGPARVREKLYEKGIPRELWEDALEELPEEGGQVDAFLQSKLRGRIPDEKEKRRLTNVLLRRGFPWGEVRAAWERLNEALADDDMADI